MKQILIIPKGQTPELVNKCRVKLMSSGRLERAARLAAKKEHLLKTDGSLLSKPCDLLDPSPNKLTKILRKCVNYRLPP